VAALLVDNYIQGCTSRRQRNVAIYRSSQAEVWHFKFISSAVFRYTPENGVWERKAPRGSAVSM